MDSASSNNSLRSLTKDFDGSRLAGCCTGQSLGCVFSFISCWVIALLISAVLTPFFGQSQGGNTAVGMLLSGLTCGGSLILGAGLSFLTGRLFPVFKKKVR